MLTLSSIAYGNKKIEQKLVLIDPGHGGPDLGARVGELYEKDLTLQIAKKLQIELAGTEVKIELTRSVDQAMTLPARVQMANEMHASLFISLHVNSGENASGPEVFILRHDANDKGEKLARLAGKGVNPLAQESGALGIALQELGHDQTRANSVSLACEISKGLQPLFPGHTHRRAIQEAHFFVLMGATMPSSLVELGFLQNPYDRALMQTPFGQYKIARSLAKSIQAWIVTPKQRTMCPINRQMNTIQNH